MTAEEMVTVRRIQVRLDEMFSSMVTKELLVSEVRRLDNALEDHSKYTQSIAEAETKRLDAIRSVDATAISVASERAVEQAGILADQVRMSAETLRALVATTALQVADTLAQVTAPIIGRLEKLEAKQYESQGRSGMSTPLLMMLAGLGGGIVWAIASSFIKLFP